jgi:hypothetical protein
MPFDITLCFVIDLGLTIAIGWEAY